jgi:hypothetical protein
VGLSVGEIVGEALTEDVGVGETDGVGVGVDSVEGAITLAIGPWPVDSDLCTANGFSGVPGCVPPNRITAETAATAAMLTAPLA